MYYLIYSTSVMNSHGKWRSQLPILLAFPIYVTSPPCNTDSTAPVCIIDDD